MIASDIDNNVKVITHEELALLWLYAEKASEAKHKGRKRKYLGLVPIESKDEYLERAWKSYNQYKSYFESLIIKYVGPLAIHEEWAIDHYTGRIKPNIKMESRQTIE